MAASLILKGLKNEPSGTDRQSGLNVLRAHRTNEVFIATVGPAGAGSGTAAKILAAFFEEEDFNSQIIKVSGVIRRAALSIRANVPSGDSRKTLDGVRMMQDRGDELRHGVKYGWDEDHSAVARLVLTKIASQRAELQGSSYSGAPVMPDGTSRVYLIDSLRHPAEVALLREVYRDAFLLLGIVCDPIKREKRIRENFFERSQWGSDSAKDQVREFLTRDEGAPEKYGQHVAATFQLADYFVDNSTDGNEDLTVTGMNDHLRRFMHLITQSMIVRPTISETAMHHARSSQMRSACLSRQVGAALVDVRGNIVATGTNDVPKAGGGLYGETFLPQVEGDNRCVFRAVPGAGRPFCSSNREQNKIIEDLIKEFPELVSGTDRQSVLKRLRRTRLGGLIEFSRAVHAEMDVILSASNSGVSPRACRMFVTTYPCHYCARHIVAAGIDEVQFIEPYPKSKATDLHGDSICVESHGWVPPSEGGKHVLFRPFVGVAPRFYRKVFLKDRKYKNDITGEYSLSEPDWGSPTDVYSASYPALENDLALLGVDVNES